MSLRLDSIICGDNVEVLSTFPDACIDLVVTSPPYDNLRTYGGHSWNFEGVAAQLTRVLKPGGVIVWVVADATVNGSETGTSMRQALHFKDVCGLRLHDTMIWDKGGFASVGDLAIRYAPVTEFMFVFSRGRLKAFNPIKDKPNIHAGTPVHGTVLDASGVSRCVSNKGKTISEFGQRFNIWSISPDKQSDHPAPFPEALARDHILSWSNEGDIVLDPFNGSGTTSKMAREFGRRFIGIDVNEDYCEIARKRLEQQLLFGIEDTKELAGAAT